MTLEVTLRQAMAGVLGISAAELCYSVRPVRLEDGQSVLAVQLYDVISGDAGFASSAPVHIEAILQGMVKQLGCRHCDRACSECLLDSQTRHDHDLLDRKAALACLEMTSRITSVYRMKRHSRCRMSATHDWMSMEDFQDFADQWFAAALGRPVELTVFDSPRDIPHHRKLTVTFEDGQVLKIRFDQGMGYWCINFASKWHYFDFCDDVSFQLVKMAQACKEGNVANSEESWATDVLVEVIAS